MYFWNVSQICIVKGSDDSLLPKRRISIHLLIAICIIKLGWTLGAKIGKIEPKRLFLGTECKGQKNKTCSRF